jgi:hypothetical protein
MAPSAERGLSGIGSRSEGLPTGLDLDGAVTAGYLNEFPDRPTGPRFDPPADGECAEDDGEIGLDGAAFAVLTGLACSLNRMA